MKLPLAYSASLCEYFHSCYITNEIKEGETVWEKKIRMIYDDEGDVLDVSLGVPVAAVSREMDDDFFVRIEPNSGEVVGFSISDFKN